MPETEDPQKTELEEPPGRLDVTPRALARTPRPALWADVPDEQWDDWRWQLAHRLNSVDELSQIINLTPEEIEGLTADEKFRVDMTPYFASLIDPDDPHCPVRRQVIPLGRELQAFEGMMEDSLAEDKHSPVPGLVHRYPDRVLMLLTTQCASYCRYCTRSRIVGNPHANFSRAEYDLQLDYLRRTPAGARRAAQRRRSADPGSQAAGIHPDRLARDRAHRDYPHRHPRAGLHAAAHHR